MTVHMMDPAFTKELNKQYCAAIAGAHEQLEAEYYKAGWVQQPLENNEILVRQIRDIAQEIQRFADVLVVVGIGGSYLGAKAIQTALSPYFSQPACAVMYIGHNLSTAYIEQLLHSLDGKSVYVNAVSKSGTTLESALAFRIVRHYMEGRYENASSRILVTTDANSSCLKQLAEQNQYRQLTIPTNIGGRYSVLTAVGLLPLAVAGIDIAALLDGAKDAALDLKAPDLLNNPAYRYAASRHFLYRAGYRMELLATFEPKLTCFQQWWTQLFAESEGKARQGLYPCGAQFPTDLHSIGQFIQDGSPVLFETMLHVNEAESDFVIPFDVRNIDQLNYIAGMGMQELTNIAKNGVIAAHREANVPVLELQIERLDAYHLGYLCYFFMKACAMSALLLRVNPFDQPGVEAYKQKIQALLQETTHHATSS